MSNRPVARSSGNSSASTCRYTDLTCGRPRAPPGDFHGRLVFFPPIADLSTTHQPSVCLQLSRPEICPERATLPPIVHTEKWRRTGTRCLGPAPEESVALTPHVPPFFSGNPQAFWRLTSDARSGAEFPFLYIIHIYIYEDASSGSSRCQVARLAAFFMSSAPE